MQESEKRRAAIVNRLLTLKLSTKKELHDIIRLTAIICQTPTVLISLLDNEKQYLDVRLGFDQSHTPLEDAFCQYTILQDEVMEVTDSWLDERFVNNRLVTDGPHIRFYAGSPLKTHAGDRLGSLCVIDTKPNALNDMQKQTLEILARQVTTILEFELSLQFLKEEIHKVEDSEMKLKSIFQSSPTSHILIDKNLTVKAFNKAASDFIRRFGGQQITEGDSLSRFASPSLLPVLLECIESAFAGYNRVIEKEMLYGQEGTIWWEMKFNPVYNHINEITGVAIDSTNVTDERRDKQNILTQNSALQKIAQMQSHEIRRPVANIIELADLMTDKDEEDFDLNLKYLKEEILCLDRTIHQIVELSSNSNIAS